MPPSANRRSKKKPPPPAPKNRRSNPRQRALKARTRSAVYDPPTPATPLSIPVWAAPVARVLLALWVLLPAALITTAAFFDTFADAAIAGGAWRSQGFWFFTLGLGIWMIAFFTLPRPTVAYVLGHELTHAFFIILHGGRIERFEVSPDGGFVVTDKNNLVISLSPYFVPFYTVFAIALFAVSGLFIDVGHTYTGLLGGLISFKPIWAAFALVGFTWGFHLTFTIWMIAKDQPDLRHYGIFFSLVLIYLVNLAIISTGLIAACGDTTFTTFGHHWIEHARDLARWASGVARAALAI